MNLMDGDRSNLAYYIIISYRGWIKKLEKEGLVVFLIEEKQQSIREIYKVSINFRQSLKFLQICNVPYTLNYFIGRNLPTVTFSSDFPPKLASVSRIVTFTPVKGISMSDPEENTFISRHDERAFSQMIRLQSITSSSN